MHEVLKFDDIKGTRVSIACSCGFIISDDYVKRNMYILSSSHIYIQQPHAFRN